MKEDKFCIIRRWSASFVVVSLLYAIICIIIKRRLNIDIGYLKVFFGIAISAIFAAISITVFKMKNGNAIVKTLIAIVILLPAVFVARWVFGIIVFRYSFVVYAVASVCALVYGVTVFFNAAKAKKEADSLNSLLVNNKKTSQKD